MSMRRKDGLENQLAAKAAEVSTLSAEQERKHKQVLEQALSGSAGSSKLKSKKQAPGPGMKAVYSQTEVDENGEPVILRWIKIKEPRKVLPVYVPESLFQEFDRTCDDLGVSRNATINQMIRSFVAEHDDTLK